MKIEDGLRKSLSSHWILRSCLCRHLEILDKCNSYLEKPFNFGYTRLVDQEQNYMVF